MIVVDTINNSNYSEYYFTTFKEGILKNHSSPIKKKTLLDLISSNDSIFVNVNFEYSRIAPGQISNDTLFVQRQMFLDEVILNKSKELIKIETYGNKSDKKCKSHLNSDFYLMAMPTDSIIDSYLKSISVLFKKSKKEMFGAKTPKAKRFKYVIYVVDSLNKFNPHLNKPIYASPVLSVEASREGWITADLKQLYTDIPDYKYLIFGIQTMDFNVTIPCFNTFDSRNQKFITLIRQSEYTENGRIEYFWKQHDESVTIPKEPPVQILPIRLIFEK